jgi:DNA-binding response OmpR family regulator
MNQARLLIVEDQLDIRKLIRLTLDIGDYELHEAENGESGWHMVRALRPNLVLLDVMMPGMLDGYQVCRKIKDEPGLAGTVVILLTARGQQADIEAGRAAGADAYLIKPFSPLELIDTVEAALAKQTAGG